MDPPSSNRFQGVYANPVRVLVAYAAFLCRARPAAPDGCQPQLLCQGTNLEQRWRPTDPTSVDGRLRPTTLSALLHVSRIVMTFIPRAKSTACSNAAQNTRLCNLKKPPNVNPPMHRTAAFYKMDPGLLIAPLGGRPIMTQQRPISTTDSMPQNPPLDSPHSMTTRATTGLQIDRGATLYLKVVFTRRPISVTCMIEKMHVFAQIGLTQTAVSRRHRVVWS